MEPTVYIAFPVVWQIQLKRTKGIDIRIIML